MKYLKYILIIAFLFLGQSASAQLSVLRPTQGGTGIGSATVGQIGQCVKVLTAAPFLYELGTCGSGGGGISFSADNTYNQQVYSTSTPTLWFKSGLFASSTSYFDTTSTLYSSTTYASFLHASTTKFTFGGVTGSTWTDFCTAITGSSALCDGDDANGGSGFAFPWTPTTNFNVNVNSTTTPIWLRGSPFSLFASTTAVLTNASTSQLTLGTKLYDVTNSAGTLGFVLASLGGGPTWVATTTFSAPLLYSAGNVTCRTADTSNSGCISNTDWNTFNGKQGTITVSFPIQLTGSALSWTGLSTSSGLTAGQSLYATGVNTIAGTATSTCPIFSTGLSYSGTSAFCIGGTNGNVTVNTSQNITTLSNLTNNGFVQTSGSNGTLGVQQFPCTVAQGCTNKIAYPANSIITSDSAGTTLIATTSDLTVSSLLATSTSATSTIRFKFAIGSSTAPMLNSFLSITGTENNYMQGNMQNTSTGNNASSNWVVTAENGTDSTYFAEFGINNSKYSQSAFSAQNAGDAFLNVNDGALTLGTASSTNSLADLRFLTGGTSSTSIRAMIDYKGNFMYGTTTQTNIASSTYYTPSNPQLSLSSGVGMSQWTLRNAYNTFYLATTTTAGLATSTKAALVIDFNGKMTLNAMSGVGCAQWDATGLLTNTGTACGSGSGGGSNPFTPIYGTWAVGTTSSVAFGTTTISGSLSATLTSASTSAPQIALSSGAGYGLWTERNSYGTYYLSTTSVDGLSTSTQPVLSVNTNGKLRIASMPSCDTIDTDATGLLTCGTDATTPVDSFSHAFPWLSATTSSIAIGTTTISQNISSTLTLSSSTASQLGLFGGGGFAGWDLYNSAGSFYMTTTTIDGLSTTTIPGFAIASSTGDTYIQGTLNIGTTTPLIQKGRLGAIAKVIIATTTGNQIGLSQGGGLTWTIGNQGGNLYMASTTIDGTATSTISALTILSSNGRTGIGSTTPFGALSIDSATNITNPSFVIGNSVSTNFSVGTSTNSWMSVGSSTVNSTTAWLGLGVVNIATTTAPQIALASGAGFSNWTFTATSNALYIATTTVSGLSTSTVASFWLDKNGNMNTGPITTCNGATSALGVTANTVLCDTGVSDIRLKKNVSPITNGLETILKLKPISFYWKDLTNHNTQDPREQHGFAAQDVRGIIPSAVGTTTPQNGTNGEDALTLDKTIIIPYLVDAVQQLAYSKGMAVKRSVEENWEWGLIIGQFVLFGGYVIYNEKRRK